MVARPDDYGVPEENRAELSTINDEIKNFRWVSDPSTCLSVILLTTLVSYRTVSPVAVNIEHPVLSLINTFAMT